LLLRLLVPSFPHPQVTNDPPLVYKIHGRPVAVVVALPSIEVVVDGDRILNGMFPNVALHISNYALITELGSVHSDHHKPLVRVFLMPCLYVGFDIAAVVTTEGPKLYQDYFPFEIGKRKGAELSQLCPLISGAGIPTPAFADANATPANEISATVLKKRWEFLSYSMHGYAPTPRHQSSKCNPGAPFSRTASL